MHIGQVFIMEMEHEVANTRKMLERIPEAQYGYKPHEKSMSLISLATHVAEMFSWIPGILPTAELDFATMPYNPPVVNNNAELLALLDKSFGDAKEALAKADNAVFMENWTMRNGEQIFFTLPKAAVVRSMVLSHHYHHRGQISVYLRLLNVPVPGMYGPSADEGSMM